MQSDDSLIIRPAQAGDRAAVLAFTASIWNGEDYIHTVWDHWLTQEPGPFLVAIKDQQPVGLIKTTFQGEGSCWIRGLRVSEAYRRQGIANRLIEETIRLAIERGDRYVHFMTGLENQAMQRVAELLGFYPMVSGRYYFHAGPAAAAWDLIPATPEDLPQLLADVGKDTHFNFTSGFYTVDWEFFVFTPAELARRVQLGDVWKLPGSPAWGIITGDEEAWIGYVYGSKEEKTLLAQKATAHPRRSPAEKCWAIAPEKSNLPPILLRAGFEADSHSEICYELELSAWEASRPLTA